jgi:hypothetical protein
MKIKTIHSGNLIFILLFILSIVSCSSRSSSYSDEDNEGESSYSENNNSEDEDEEGIEDGTHSAAVDYYNPKTGYSQSYNLDVEVEDGEVNQINFPNGGYLDNSHINSGELQDGNTTLEDENGRSYEITIDD